MTCRDDPPALAAGVRQNGRNETREAVTLDAASVEAISRRVAELLRDAPLPGEVDAQTVARTLGVERSWVYAHADEIGGIRLGNGPKA